MRYPIPLLLIQAHLIPCHCEELKATKQSQKRDCFASLAMTIIAFVLIILILSPVIVFSEEYKIETGDVVSVTVYEQPDLSTKARVDSSGEITVPLIGNVSIGGLSENEAVKKITALLEKDYLVNPHVSIFIQEYHPKKVFVMGFVNRPGEYELFKDRDTTVIEAITMAGGFKEGAAQNGTKIIRKENNTQITIPVKIADITQKGRKEEDIPLKPGDVIFVPESFF